jgi:ubiquinone/menaquinone biosynthesis C-methylase UbiE
MAANYDNTVWFYERLSKLVFGRSQIEAQEHFLNHIPPQANILIIGGGTGRILESITRLHSSGLQITYVDMSSKMMALSRRRNTGKNNVTYVTEGIQDISFTTTFDVVITAFLFDNFSEAALAKMFPLINAQVNPGGLWLNTDFQLTGPLWQKLLLKSMYAFFNAFKAVEVNQLPNVERVFGQYGYDTEAQRSFYRNFIIAKAYRKGSEPSG